MTVISVGSMRAVDHSPMTIALFCCVGLAASFCLLAFGLDLGTGVV